MNAVDIFLAALTLLATFIGYRYGALRLLLELFKWTASVAGGIAFYSLTVDEVVKRLPELSKWYLPFSLALIFIVIYLFFSLSYSILMRGSTSENRVHIFDKISGLIPGLLIGILISAVTGRLLTFSAIEQISKKAETSAIATTLSPYTELAENNITPLVKNYFSNNSSTTKEEVVYATSVFTVRPDLEQQMLKLVNAERKKRNLKPLVFDDSLKQVARAHSSDMLRRGYFSHRTPEGKDPFDRKQKYFSVILLCRLTFRCA
jgi:uncharacterized membrane protein required for colicin V production